MKRECVSGTTVKRSRPVVCKNLDKAENVDTFIEGVTKYHATEHGPVKWRESPEHFCKKTTRPVAAQAALAQKLQIFGLTTLRNGGGRLQDVVK